METKMIAQSDLTADCWLIQVWGLESCETCESKGTAECGGKAILAKINKGKFPSSGLPDKAK